MFFVFLFFIVSSFCHTALGKYDIFLLYIVVIFKNIPPLKNFPSTRSLEIDAAVFDFPFVQGASMYQKIVSTKYA